MNVLSKQPYTFRYLEQFSGSRQLYFDENYNNTGRKGYWQCTKYKTFLSTSGDELKNPDSPLPTHLGHEGKLAKNRFVIYLI